MKYVAPDSTVLVISDVVYTSQDIVPTSPSDSGGIQLPFIPG